MRRVLTLDAMAHYKPVDRSPRLLPVLLSEQIQPGTFEFFLDHLVDHELDLSALDARFNNDEVGASAYDPRVMLKIVLLAYSRGLVSSRSIEHACTTSNSLPSVAAANPATPTSPKFVRELVNRSNRWDKMSQPGPKGLDRIAPMQKSAQ